MYRYFPQFSAAVAVAGLEVAATAVSAAPAALHPVGVHLAPPPAAASPAVPVANNTNTPAQAPIQPGQTVLSPGFGVAQQVGTGGVPGTPSFTEGFGTTSPFAGTSMNQPGQPPFLEGFSGNQGVGSLANQPGQPDFYDGFGFNRGVVPANQGAQPMTPFPNYTVPPQPNVVGLANGTTVLTTSTLGFYNGFGGGQPDFGFYAGFTTPR
jgi:hypothetical protein